MPTNTRSEGGSKEATSRNHKHSNLQSHASQSVGYRRARAHTTIETGASRAALRARRLMYKIWR
eukprot:6201690-Alexandrium_andersonii.AAC.1